MNDLPRFKEEFRSEGNCSFITETSDTQMHVLMPQSTTQSCILITSLTKTDWLDHISMGGNQAWDLYLKYLASHKAPFFCPYVLTYTSYTMNGPDRHAGVKNLHVSVSNIWQALRASSIFRVDVIRNRMLLAHRRLPRASSY